MPGYVILLQGQYVPSLFSHAPALVTTPRTVFRQFCCELVRRPAAHTIRAMFRHRVLLLRRLCASLLLLVLGCQGQTVPSSQTAPALESVRKSIEYLASDE